MVQYQWMTRSRLLKPRVVKVVVVTGKMKWLVVEMAAAVVMVDTETEAVATVVVVVMVAKLAVSGTRTRW
jgi:hypothetical protein